MTHLPHIVIPKLNTYRALVDYLSETDNLISTRYLVKNINSISFLGGLLYPPFHTIVTILDDHTHYINWVLNPQRGLLNQQEQ